MEACGGLFRSNEAEFIGYLILLKTWDWDPLYLLSYHEPCKLLTLLMKMAGITFG